MRKEVKEWIVNFFEKRKGIPGETEEEKLKVDYFQTGLLESIEVVDLILGIEEKFEVKFTPERMQDRRFCYIGGLANIISEMMDHPG